VLPVDTNTAQNDPDTLLMDFCKAEKPSHTKQLQQATLAAKANIFKVETAIFFLHLFTTLVDQKWYPQFFSQL